MACIQLRIGSIATESEFLFSWKDVVWQQDKDAMPRKGVPRATVCETRPSKSSWAGELGGQGDQAPVSASYPE
eukprot:1248151-Amphidinium_carterae.1